MNLYCRSLCVNSALTPEEFRARIRHMVEQRLLPQTTRSRLGQIAGWAYEECHDGFTLRPNPSSGWAVYCARFVGRVEAAGSASRIVRFVREHWVVRAIVTLLLFATTAMTLASLREPHWTYWRDIIRNLAIRLGMMVACVLMVRFDLLASEHMIRDGFALAESADILSSSQKPC